MYTSPTPLNMNKSRGIRMFKIKPRIPSDIGIIKHHHFEWYDGMSEEEEEEMRKIWKLPPDLVVDFIEEYLYKRCKRLHLFTPGSSPLYEISSYVDELYYCPELNGYVVKTATYGGDLLTSISFKFHQNYRDALLDIKEHLIEEKDALEDYIYELDYRDIGENYIEKYREDLKEIESHIEEIDQLLSEQDQL